MTTPNNPAAQDRLALAESALADFMDCYDQHVEPLGECVPKLSYREFANRACELAAAWEAINQPGPPDPVQRLRLETPTLGRGGLYHKMGPTGEPLVTFDNPTELRAFAASLQQTAETWQARNDAADPRVRLDSLAVGARFKMSAVSTSVLTRVALAEGVDCVYAVDNLHTVKRLLGSVLVYPVS